MANRTKINALFQCTIIRVNEKNTFPKRAEPAQYQQESRRSKRGPKAWNAVIAPDINSMCFGKEMAPPFYFKHPHARIGNKIFFD
jgi:hypothetical protein